MPLLRQRPQNRKNKGKGHGVDEARVKYGVLFPHGEIGDDPGLIRDFAQTAEAVGFDFISSYDHVLGAERSGRVPPLPGTFDEKSAFHEPLILFGFLAGVTSSIEFALGVLILPQRQVALLAKQAAEVDLLSGGRLLLGVGTGWNYVEYSALGADWRTRGARQEEQIEVLRLLWERELVDYQGKWHQLERVAIAPRPKRRIPLWLGGYSDVVLRRAARVADGFVFGPNHDASEYIPRLKGYLQERGRKVSEFGFDVGVPRYGFESDLTADVARFRRAGATAITISATRRGLSPREHVDSLATLYETVQESK